MLDPSQHGFRANHGTDSASLLLIDALEHAQETHTACLVSSWDIRRAFDSISKPALQMAWTRLGVPPEWASFLIQLDIEGLTSIRLPVSQFAHDKTGQAGLSRLRTLGATDILFPAEREVPKEISPALLGGTQSMISYSELSQSNADLLQTQPRKPLPTPTTSSLSAAPSPAYNNKPTS